MNGEYLFSSMKVMSVNTEVLAQPNQEDVSYVVREEIHVLEFLWEILKDSKLQHQCVDGKIRWK
jgi:hypothetical protein